MRRRRMRRYRPGRENSVMKFAVVFGIILCAVVCGYLTARFALGPIFGYDTEVLKLDFPSKMTALLEEASDRKGDDSGEDEVKVKNKDHDQKEAGGYVLQFGVFSSKSGARTLLNQLAEEGITAEIEEEDGSYKVVGETLETKEEALKQLETLKDEKNIDVFIDTID